MTAIIKRLMAAKTRGGFVSWSMRGPGIFWNRYLCASYR